MKKFLVLLVIFLTFLGNILGQTSKLKIGEFVDFKDNNLTISIQLNSTTKSKVTFDEINIICYNKDTSIGFAGKIMGYIEKEECIIIKGHYQAMGYTQPGAYKITTNKVVFKLALFELFKVLGTGIDKSDILAIIQID